MQTAILQMRVMFMLRTKRLTQRPHTQAKYLSLFTIFHYYRSADLSLDLACTLLVIVALVKMPPKRLLNILS